MEYLVVLTLAYRDGSRMCYADYREVVTVEVGQKTNDILQTAHDAILANENVPDTVRPEDCAVVCWSITPNMLLRPPASRQMSRK